MKELECLLIERNCIKSVREIAKLRNVPKLCELSIKDNPELDTERALTEFCLLYIKRLEILDGKDINDLLNESGNDKKTLIEPILQIDQLKSIDSNTISNKLKQCDQEKHKGSLLSESEPSPHEPFDTLLKESVKSKMYQLIKRELNEADNELRLSERLNSSMSEILEDSVNEVSNTHAFECTSNEKRDENVELNDSYKQNNDTAQQTVIIQMENCSQQTQGVEIVNRGQQTHAIHSVINYSQQTISKEFKEIYQQTDNAGIRSVGCQTEVKTKSQYTNTESNIEQVNVHQQTEEYSDTKLNIELIETLSLLQDNKIINNNLLSQTTGALIGILKEHIMSKLSSNELDIEFMNDNISYITEKETSTVVSSCKHKYMPLLATKKNIECEHNEFKHKLAEQETIILNQNKLIEELTMKVNRQAVLKAKIQNYKNQIEDLQNQLEKISKGLIENVKRSSDLYQDKQTINKKAKEYEILVKQLTLNCNQYKEEYNNLKEEYNLLKTKECNPKTINNLINVNKYLEKKLANHMVDKEEEQISFSWEMLEQFIENVKMYIRKMRKYKEQIKEFEETKSEFVKHVEEQLAELNKSWSLVKERESENQEFMAQLIKREEELIKKQHDNVSITKIHKSELDRAIEGLESEKEKIILELEDLKRKHEGMRKEISNSEVIMNNCKRVIDTQTSEIANAKQEMQELENNKQQLIEELKELNEDIGQKEEELHNINASIKKTKGELSRLGREQEDILKYINMKEREIKDAENDYRVKQSVKGLSKNESKAISGIKLIDILES